MEIKERMIDTFHPPLSKRPRMASSELDVATTADDGNIRITICAEEAKKQSGAGPTTTNATTTSTTTTLLPVPGPIVAVDSNSSATTVNRSPTTTTIVITTTLVVTTGRNLLEVLDDPLLRTITSYVPNEDLMKVACSSKRMNRIIPRATTYESRAPGTLIPVLQMGPSKTNEGFFYKGRGRFDKLVHQLNRRDYQHASMKDYHKFTLHYSGGRDADLVHKLKTNNDLRIPGITSLDFCFSTTPPTTFSCSREEILVLETLPHLLPSLREVDLTHTVVHQEGVRGFFANCSRLEKMTFHMDKEDNFLYWNFFPLNGEDMEMANHLKELNMDDTTFCTSGREIAAMSDLDDTTNPGVVGSKKNVFLFHKGSTTVLERVSMRNATYCVSDSEPTIMPQKALLKFIRNAPATLRWFRSTLTKDNIEILHHERPEIEFVS